MSHALEHAAIVVAGFVAAAMALMLVAALSAYKRDRRPFVLWIAAAFGVFALKNLGLVTVLWIHFGPHELVELMAALMDLVVAALLVAPLVIRRTDD
jgi:hypothetical protein